MKYPYNRVMAIWCFFFGHRWWAYDLFADKCLRCNKEARNNEVWEKCLACWGSVDGDNVASNSTVPSNLTQL